MPTVATVLSHDAQVWNLDQPQVFGALLTDGRAVRAVGDHRTGWSLASRAEESFRPATDAEAALGQVCRAAVPGGVTASAPRAFAVELDTAANLLAAELGLAVLNPAPA
jgi:hypothetical protein